MNEERAYELLKEVLSDTRSQPITIPVREVYMLVTYLQLVARHPHLSYEQKKFCEHIGRQFQNTVVALHPQVQALLEMGWRTDFDVVYCPNCRGYNVQPDALGSGLFECLACSHRWEVK